MIFENFFIFIILLFFLIILIDILFIKNDKKFLKFNIFVKFIKYIMPIILFLFVFRSFIIEPFRIPSRSMVPALFDGDFILVNKFIYGVRIPIINKKIIDISSPKIGDMIVFKHFSGKNFVKRVIGCPGDHIKYDNENLYVNNNLFIKLYFSEDVDVSHDSINIFPIESYKEEFCDDKYHNIYLRPWFANAFYINNNIIVPNNSYYVMGDNRSTSHDSRSWGVVKDDDIVGQVFFVWFSWDLYYKDIRWNRICINVL
ncbi:MAG: signal peptidase I [Candidatus Azosocius agrarius]|nr:MAG: signal peptidase I [Gammaproteobacteria bacterium]